MCAGWRPARRPDARRGRATASRTSSTPTSTRSYAVAPRGRRLGGADGGLEAAAPRAFQRVGLVRYNPFEDTGGNQSFALALLDAEGNGWVLSSLHARAGTRVYAKAIAGGRADAALSEEETARHPAGTA